LRGKSSDGLEEGLAKFGSHDPFIRTKIIAMSSNDVQKDSPTTVLPLTVEDKEDGQGSRRLGSLHSEWPNDGMSETTVKVINSMCDPSYDGYFDAAVSDWGLSTALSFEKYNWGEGMCNPSQTYHDGFINVINGNFNEGWSGLASYQYQVLSGDRKRLTAVLVYMNDRLIHGHYEKSQVMCHEIGHAVGLSHPNEDHFDRNTGSCMDYSAFPQGGVHDGFDFGPSNERPSNQDYIDLYDAYFNNGNRRLESGDEWDYIKAPGVDRTDYSLMQITIANEALTRVKTAELVPGGEDEHKVDVVSVHMGQLVSEVHVNGIVEKRYELLDEESGILTVSVATGIDD
jgi:hypothetical protein